MRDQLRAARALPGWTLADLAKRSTISANAITRYETGARSTRACTRILPWQALEDAVLPGAGIRGNLARKFGLGEARESRPHEARENGRGGARASDDERPRPGDARGVTRASVA